MFYNVCIKNDSIKIQLKLAIKNFSEGYLWEETENVKS